MFFPIYIWYYLYLQRNLYSGVSSPTIREALRFSLQLHLLHEAQETAVQFTPPPPESAAAAAADLGNIAVDDVYLLRLKPSTAVVQERSPSPPAAPTVRFRIVQLTPLLHYEVISQSLIDQLSKTYFGVTFSAVLALIWKMYDTLYKSRRSDSLALDL